MEKQKKKQVKKVISWVLILSVVALLAALPMLAAQEELATGPQASILSATAQKRDVSAVLLGGGTVTADETEAVTIPAAVKVKEYLVSNGDLVEEGQPIATVDRVSVMTAITQVQQTLEDLSNELDDVRTETESSRITATAGGTVKAVYAAEGEEVQDVLLRDGALAVISLDGLMAVQIQRSTNLSGGDMVCVTLSDGTELDGRVESNLEGILTVTVADNGYAAGTAVTVTTDDGDRIGSGKLYIHSPWNVVAYSGRISRVRIEAGQTVDAGQRLFDLTIDGYTSRFDSLSSQHREYEELMLELFKMYQSETVTAPRDGMVSGVDEDGTYMLSNSNGGWKITFLANGPNDDQNTYTNYVGQVTQVAIDGLIVRMNPQPQEVSDYTQDLANVNKSVEAMGEPVPMYGFVPTYQLEYEEEIVVVPGTEENGSDAMTAAEGENTQGEEDKTENENPPVTEVIRTPKWVQINPSAGDILLFAFDGNGPVWAIRLGGSSSGGEVPGGNGGSRPGMSGGGMSGMGSFGGMSGMGGGMGQENSEELYALDTVTIASVTAQETVTVPITVDELDILKLYVGQSAEVTLDALPGQQFAGTVTSISASGESEGGNSKFTAEVTLDKIPEILPGMNASVSVVLDTVKQVVCIPVAALNEMGTATQVYRSYDEEIGDFADPVAVTTGISDGEYVQILSGVAEGEMVYYPYYDKLVISNAPEAGGFPFG